MLQTKPVCRDHRAECDGADTDETAEFLLSLSGVCYNVLEWIVETEVCTPLQFDDAQAPGEWCLQALTLLREKQQLMRKISQALGQDTMYRITERIIRPQLSRLLPDPDAVDSATHSLALDMLCQATFCTVDSLVARRTPINVEACTKQLRALFLTVYHV